MHTPAWVRERRRTRKAEDQLIHAHAVREALEDTPDTDATVEPEQWTPRPGMNFATE